MKSFSLTSFAVFALIVIFALFLQSPELEAATFGTCQVFSSPGVYNLTGHINAVAGDCLVVNANNVTIDLGGYRISHLTDGGSAFGNDKGVSGSATKNVTIVNGRIANFEYGIQLNAANCKLKDLAISGNYVGATVGKKSVIDSNTFESNEEIALDLYNSPKTTVAGNRFINNNRHALVGVNSIVRNNFATGGNEDSINVGDNSLVSGNYVYDTYDEGLLVGKNSIVTNNKAYRNGDYFDLNVSCPSYVAGNSAGIALLIKYEAGDGDCVSVNNSFHELNP